MPAKTKQQAAGRARAKTARPGASAAASGPGISKLRELVAIMEKSNLAELSYEDVDVAVALKRAFAPGSAPLVMSPPPMTIATAPNTAPAAPSHHVVHSPFVGTFYRSPSPDEPAFLEVGDRVKKGQTLCIVEAMKLMNEIESDADGVVVRVLVENAQPVQYGDALFEIDTAAS
jgi:acetyl-CoA carboxylase biotin carboxyl carrier protein